MGHSFYVPRPTFMEHKIYTCDTLRQEWEEVVKIQYGECMITKEGFLLWNRDFEMQINLEHVHFCYSMFYDSEKLKLIQMAYLTCNFHSRNYESNKTRKQNMHFWVMSQLHVC